MIRGLFYLSNKDHAEILYILSTNSINQVRLNEELFIKISEPLKSLNLILKSLTEVSFDFMKLQLQEVETIH